MIPCVVFDAVSTFDHFVNQGGVLLNQSANTKETGLGVVLFEDIKNAWREFGVRAIVKRQGNNS